MGMETLTETDPVGWIAGRLEVVAFTLVLCSYSG